MKQIIFITAILLVIMVTACNKAAVRNQSDKEKTEMQTFKLDTSKLEHGQLFYQYSMDPQVISDKPGSCPVCGMDLSEMKKH